MASSMIHVYLDQEEFALNKLPLSLAQLQFLIEEVFADKLPSYWSLKFEDAYGKLAPLVTSEDYQVLLDHYGFFSGELKIQIIARNEVDPILTQSKNNKEKEDSDKALSESFDIVSEEKDSFQSESGYNEILDNLDFEVKENSISQDNGEISIVEDEITAQTISKVEQGSSPIRTSQIEQSCQTERNIFERQIPLFGLKTEILQLKEVKSTQNKIIQTYSECLSTQNKEIQFSPLSSEQGNQTRNEESMSDSQNSGSIRRKSLTIDVPSPYLVKQDSKEDIGMDQSFKSSKHNIKINNNKKASQEVVVEPTASLPQLVLLAKDSFDDSSKRTILQTEIQKPNHNGCYCDGCGVRPITGIRYKCSTCPNFDFCENCEATKAHPHLFLKINHPRDYSKIERSKQSSQKIESDDFSFRKLGNKLKETTLIKVLNNTYGQIPNQLMKTVSKMFKGFKNDSADSPSSQDYSQSSEEFYTSDEEEEEYDDDEYEYEEEEEEEEEYYYE